MNILKYLYGILKDISEDFDNAEIDAAPSSKRGGAGMFAILWPQLAGAVFGLAVARIFKTDAAGYIAFAVLFGIIGGTYKSVSYDKVSLKHAVVRNLLIATVFAILIWITAKLND